MLTPTRQKIKVFDLRFTLLSLGLLITIGLLLTLLVRSSASTTDSAWQGEAEHWKNVAVKLQAVGLNEEAARYYQRYLQAPRVGQSVKSSVAFALGELYEELLQPAAALSWYYQVELFDAQGAQKDAAGRKIVELLEKLNKVSAAKHALAEETTLHAEDGKNEAAPPQGAKLVARLGDKNIYLHQVQAALDTLPPALQEKARSKEGLREFTRQYVADELLYAKALRLQYHEDSAFAKNLEAIRRQLLVQKVIDEEVTKKITIAPKDVENYFAAHRDRYSKKDVGAKGVGKAVAPPPPTLFKDVQQQVTADYRREKAQDMYAHLITDTLSSEKVEFIDE